MNKKVRKSLSIVVTIVMMLNVIETSGITAFAAEENNQSVVKVQNVNESAAAKDITVNNTEAENTKEKNFISKVNAGQANLNDYTSEGLAIVNEENISYVNAMTRGGTCTTINEIKTKVSSIVNTYNAVKNIYNGKGTSKDYIALGINNTNDKIDWINAEVSEKINKSLSKDDVTGKIASIKSSVSTAMSYYSTVKIINEGKETNSGVKSGPSSEDNCIRQYIDIGAGYIKYKENITLLRKAILIGRYEQARDLTKNEIRKVISDTLKNRDASYICQPLLNVLGSAAAKKGSKLTKEEAAKIVNNQSAAVDAAYLRIVCGEGSLTDYQLLSISGVTAENLIWLNAEIKENIDIKLTVETVNGRINNIQDKVNKLMKYYPSVRVINDGQETNSGVKSGPSSEDNCIKQYIDIGGGYIKYDANVNLLRKSIIIGRFAKARDLTIQEILSFKTNTINNPDAPYIYVPLIEALQNAESLKGSKLTAQEALLVIDKRTAEINQAYERIVKGDGSLADFNLVRITGVTKENLVWLNAEIKENIDINLVSQNIDGKINNVQNKIRTLLGYYLSIRAINDGHETNSGVKSGPSSEDNCIKQYIDIGGGYIKYDANVNLLRKAIVIGRYAKARDLTRQEILNIKTKTLKNPDSAYILDPLLDALGKGQAQKGSKLTAQESLNIIDETTDELVEAYDRIYYGEGELEDYKFLRITGVTAENLTWLTAEIKENIDIVLKKETIDGKINNLQGKITAIMRYYPSIRIINDGHETNSGVKSGPSSEDNCIKQLIDIGGGYIKYDTYVNLMRKMILIGRYSKARDLTRQEILNIKTQTLNNPDSPYIWQAILSALDNAKAQKGRNLTAAEGCSTINNTIKRMDEAYERIINGSAGLKDYQLICIKGVTAENIIWLNAEIKENVDIHLIKETKNGKINNLQAKLNNILKYYASIRIINDGKETNSGVKSGPSSEDNCIKQYIDIGAGYIKYDANITLLRKALAITRDAKGRDMTKKEINDVIKSALKNPDTKYLVEPLRDSINVVKANKRYTSDDVLKAIDDTLHAVDGAYKRIVDGDGTLKDFHLVRITGVTAQNIQWLNDEIKENIDIKLVFETGNGKINNAQNKITKMLAYYPIVKKINDGKETNSGVKSGPSSEDNCIKEYVQIGYKYLKYNVYVSKTRKAIAIARGAKGRDLTKQEILNVLKKF